jgi:hypothetical protein
MRQIFNLSTKNRILWISLFFGLLVYISAHLHTPSVRFRTSEIEEKQFDNKSKRRSAKGKSEEGVYFFRYCVLRTALVYFMFPRRAGGHCDGGEFMGSRWERATGIQAGRMPGGTS